MKFKQTKPHHLREPEVVLNLWAYADEDGTVLRLAGKAYALEGSDEDKLAVLRNLAKTDFLSARWEKVPANFKIDGPDGRMMQGVAHASMVSEPSSHASLFGPLMDLIAGGLPEQLRSVDGDYVKFRLDLSETPLTVTTVVIEYEDGRIEPMVSGD